MCFSNLKNIIKEGIFTSLQFSGINQLSKLKNKNKIKILTYHRILNNSNIDDSPQTIVSTEKFEKQINYLKKNYNIIPLKDLLKKEIKNNSAIITFDDGYEDNYKNAFPILKKLNLPATIFLTSGYIGKEKILPSDAIFYLINKSKKYSNLSPKKRLKKYIKVNEELKLNPNREKEIKKLFKKHNLKIPKARKMLSWKQIKEMTKHNINFGSHTINHRILTTIKDKKELEKEIKQSKIDIEKKIKKKVISFAYPNGNLNKQAENIVKKHYKIACTTIPGLNKKEENKLKLKRIDINPNFSINNFKTKLSGLFLK